MLALQGPKATEVDSKNSRNGKIRWLKIDPFCNSDMLAIERSRMRTTKAQSSPLPATQTTGRVYSHQTSKIAPDTNQVGILLLFLQS